MARKSGDMSVREAGRKGGEATRQTHDRSFYSEIGRKGGQKGGQREHELVEEGKMSEGA